MRRHARAVLGLALILVAAQGCAGFEFDKFFENLLIAAGRMPPDPAVACGSQDLRIPPGTCTLILNMCRTDFLFVQGDSFAFIDPPPWLSVTAKSRPDEFTREICVAPDAPIVVDTFPYRYSNPHPQLGVLVIETGLPPLRATATATPSTISRGASSQLLATGEGGRPPYSYSWSPIFDLVPGFLAQNPIATPRETTLYQVEVTDDAGQRVTASVTVTVIQPPAGADLAVSVADSPDPVIRNFLLTYTVSIRNNGPETATNVTLAVTPPLQAESGPLTPSQGTCTRAGTSFNCAIGTIANGDTVTATIQMLPFSLGTISLSATAGATQTDPNTANNSATQSTTVQAPN